MRRIEVAGFLELSVPLVEHMKDMKIDPAEFFKEQIDESIKRLGEKIANELRIISPCLTSYLILEPVSEG